MTDRDDFPQRVETPETLTRGDAMRAASEWVGEVRYNVAKKAAWQSGDNEDLAYAAAQNALSQITELPSDSEFPNDEERRWRLRVQLHANAVNLTYEEASVNLREDFKRYVQLLDTALAAWQQNDLTGTCKAPAREIMEFSYFWCNECGMDATEPIRLLEGFHKKVCIL